MGRKAPAPAPTVAPTPAPTPAPTVAPTPACAFTDAHSQCIGLDKNMNAQTVEECRNACCTDSGCGVWQWSPYGSGCWMGQSNDCSGGYSLTHGGRKAPAPAPTVAPTPAPTPAPTVAPTPACAFTDAHSQCIG